MQNEKIEHYLTNKLSAPEREQFEREMNADGNLRSEVDMQRELVDVLRAERKAQLKARLNAIDVSTPWYTSNTFRIASGVIITALIGTGLYFNSNKETEITISNDTASDNTVMVDNTTQNNEIVVVDNANKTNTDSKETIVKEEKNTSIVPVKENTTPVKKVKQNTITNDAVININEPGFEQNNDQIVKDGSTMNPTGNFDQQSVTKKSSVDVEIKKSSKEPSYQYYSNKLFLYGDFESKPYEIVEINTVGERKLFLKYDNVYYNIKDNQVKITRLKAVTDTTLLKQLENKVN